MAFWRIERFVQNIRVFMWLKGRYMGFLQPATFHEEAALGVLPWNAFLLTGRNLRSAVPYAVLCLKAGQRSGML